ncbi:MAG TPA: mandelate racemase/muconate lactonizing enzyme family protein [Candidatus Binatia bacterium]|nr:mandelate racemase/muconate lactonizing enzyme family protein [Candidatus Binatia bacterium]
MPKIERITYFKAVSPESRPIADSTHSIPEIAFLVTRIETDSGGLGEAYLLAFHYSPQAILGALRDVAPLAVGREICRTGEFFAEHERESEYFGNVGLHRWAAGMINIAMWDAWARTLGVPVWKMFGVCRDRIPLYGSGGWLSYSLDELLAEVRSYVKRGFRSVKVKVGSPEIECDIERLAKVREAVGPQVRVMMDANQGMNLPSALELARAAQPLRVTWFEEPLNRTDYDGYTQLRRQAGMSIATGEREFDTVTLRELIRRDAIDLWQPDILRLGGVEAWRASAALAQAHRIPVLPHYYKEYDVPLLMTVPNALGAESFDWVDGLISQPIRMQDGFAYPNDGAGWGFDFKDGHLTELATFF